MSELLLPVFMRWFKAAASPARLCSEPRVCGPRLLQASTSGGALGYSRALQRQPSTNGPLCAVCAFVINEMKGALNSSSVQQTIMQKAIDVCNTLPTDIGASCIDFVTTYGTGAVLGRAMACVLPYAAMLLPYSHATARPHLLPYHRAPGHPVH